MAQFRGTVKGQGKAAASQLGTKKTGLTVNANGWNAGVCVDALHTSDGRDVFTVSATGGSNGSRIGQPLARVTDVDGCRVLEIWNGDDWQPVHRD